MSTPPDIEILIDISRHYGSDPAFLLAGGGNTSVKHDDRLWVLVAAYDGDPGGYAVEVYEARAPARFYRIVALPTGRSETPGFVLEAGAGVGIELLAKQLAEAVVGGMLKAVPNVST